MYTNGKDISHAMDWKEKVSFTSHRNLKEIDRDSKTTRIKIKSYLVSCLQLYIYLSTLYIISNRVHDIVTVNIFSVPIAKFCWFLLPNFLRRANNFSR